MLTLRRLWGALLLLCAASGVCAAPGIAVHHADLEHGPDRTRFVALQTFEPTPNVIEALEAGIDLHLAWQLEIVRPRDWWWPTEVWATEGTIRLHFRPLRQRYHITDVENDVVKAYPSLPHLRSALSQLARDLPPLQAVVREGDILRFRIALDPRALPPPLRLPVYLDSEWTLDSGWFETRLPAPQQTIGDTPDPPD